MPTLQFDHIAPAQPYHAALVTLRGERRPSDVHDHADFHELVFVGNGQGAQVVGGHRAELRAGDLLLGRPKDAHAFVAPTATGLQFVNIAFRSADWHRFCVSAGVDATAWEAAERPPQLAGCALGRVFDDALRAYVAGARMLDLFALWAAVVPVLEDSAARGTEPAWLRRARAALDEPAGLQAGLAAMQAAAAVSGGHLTRSMQRHHGCSAAAYVTARRLEYAADLLATTTLPVDRVATASGFGSHSYFGRRFRRRYAMAPLEFRQRAQRSVVP